MKINHKINMTILTDNNLDSLKEFNNEVIISDLNEIKKINAEFVVFNDVIRYLKHKDKEKLFKMLEEKNIHFINITSDIEESLFAQRLVIFNKGKVILEGSTISVLKEEKILKRHGIKLPFIVDLSLQLNYYNLIDSIFLDEEMLVNKLW